MTNFKWISRTMVITWMGLIFWMSAQTGETSGKLSGGLLEVIFSSIQTYFGPSSIDTERLHVILRKSAHFFAYLVLACILDRAIAIEVKTAPSQSKWAIFKAPFKRYLMVVVVCFIYAISDEIHQAFVPGRGPSVKDVLIDTLGSATGLALKGIALLTFHSRRI